jgi:RNA polymerase sigma factor (sigma-70 family)
VPAASRSSDGAPSQESVAALLPTIRRIIRARVNDKDAAEDLVQETLVRVLGASERVDDEMVEPYAVVTARNVVASMWKQQDRHRRNLHRVVDLAAPPAPDASLLECEDQRAIEKALERLSERERRALVAHEVEGESTRSLARDLGSTPGAVAVQLHRARARLRIEYLLAMENAEPPTDRCRPVLFALSSADRRRQRELDAGRHLLECELCATLSQEILGRDRARDDEVRVRVHVDADVVQARKAARDAAAQVGFSTTERTIIATAVSELTRNIVRFADVGEVVIETLGEPRPGLRISARDRGPGISDVDQALTEGYSTYRGLGLGLPGVRRLMDEFAIVSEVDHGTTVTMTKWLEGQSEQGKG